MTSEEYKAARVRLSLTQGALAELLGVRRETVMRRESGEQPISKEAVMALELLGLKKEPETFATQYQQDPSDPVFDKRVTATGSVVPIIKKNHELSRPERAPLFGGMLKAPQKK